MSVSPGEFTRRNLANTGFDGSPPDDTNVLTAASTIAANRTRTIAGGLAIADGGGSLTIEDGGRLVLP